MSEVKNEVKHKLEKISFKAASLPVFSEPLQKFPWVFYGETNLMPNYLIGQYNNCSIHKAVITSKLTDDDMIISG
jgi:hypothetical protein